MQVSMPSPLDEKSVPAYVVQRCPESADAPDVNSINETKTFKQLGEAMMVRRRK